MDINELKNTIENSFGTMIYFSGTNCSVCEVLKPKIKEEFSKNFPLINQIYLDDSSKEIYAHFSVFSVPTIIVFFEGKEFFKVSRNLSVMKFVEDVKRPYFLLKGEN